MLLAPLQWVYGSVIRARNARFDRTPAQRLQWPVISVGNLSIGGAGKTPLVICLAQMLKSAGWQPDVLSRGYGREGKQIEKVDPTGTAERFGDEPLLMARSAEIPVYVGASRYQAGLVAEREVVAGRPVHLLDDGFQHRQLHRNVDIVVVHRSDLEARLLPAGRLREPLTSLQRADVVVLREEDAGLEVTLRALVRPECLFWKVRRRLSVPDGIRKAVAFCAIARPDEFFAGLAAAESLPVETSRIPHLAKNERDVGYPLSSDSERVGRIAFLEEVTFRDHHRYTAGDIDRLAELGRRFGCDAFITTAKDEVKLDPAMRARLTAVAPLHTAELTAVLLEESVVLAQLSTLLQI
jgi:tetraacyldisaccharide 4'-kinase